MNNQEKRRIFIGIDLPYNVIEEIVRVQKILQSKDTIHATWVAKEQMHITVKFIGDVFVNQLDDIKNALHTISAVQMNAVLNGLDVFMMGNCIKIIFVTFACLELAAFSKKINLVLVPWAEQDTRPFVNHITLARVKSVDNVNSVLAMINAIKIEQLLFTIKTFSLQQSMLTSIGPEYSVIETYYLKEQ